MSEKKSPSRSSRSFVALASLFALLILSGCDSGPRVQWKDFDESVFVESLGSGKPTLIYFSAAWCPPCYEMKHTTFRNDRVIQAMNGFNRLQSDMSFSRSKKVLERGKEFGISGLPTLIFYGSSGHEVGRLSGFIDADLLIEALNDVS